MGTLVGSVDDRYRPLVRIELASGTDLLALLDTGFNGELLVSEADAIMLGFQARSGFSSAELAGCQHYQLQRAPGTILCLGAERRVEVLVSKEPQKYTKDGDPIALVGTRLLSPHLLLIDFSKGVIEIEAQD